MVISLSNKADQKHCCERVPDKKVKFVCGGVGGVHTYVCCRGRELRRFWTGYRNTQLFNNRQLFAFMLLQNLDFDLKPLT